jgi:hypothetical protein
MEAYMAIVKNAVKAMEKMMSADQVRRARLAADREILSLQLAKLRERQGVRQSDMKAFSQTAISKLERRKDMKLSTLIEYLEGIGMGLEISVYRKGAKRAGKKETLLRV